MARTYGALTAAIALSWGILAVSLHGQQAQAPAPTRAGDDQGFRFKSGVELINVTATVSDAAGRFVPGLRQDDFVVYEDDQPQTVTHFSAERLPVSLGIALDTSGSMAGEKMKEAQGAIDRFLFELLDKQDEIFLYTFSDHPTLVQDWTTDRRLLSRAISRMSASGGTAMFDAVADAVPLLSKGRNVKKALVVISDGRDTSSTATVSEARAAIRATEALVYALGIDCGSDSTRRPRNFEQRRGPMPVPFPFPFPPSPGGRRGYPPPPPVGNERSWQRCNDPVDVSALRDLTDDSGGRTEVVRDAHDLNPATASVADELSKQYYLGYPSAVKRDGKWHNIRVDVRNHAYRVRARRGYVAS
jgi:Ca-activated chloride channel family protein